MCFFLLSIFSSLNLKRVRLFLYFSFFLILASCQSLIQEKKTYATSDSGIYFVAEQIKKECFNTQSSGFLTEIFSLKTGYSFQLEGSWKQNFKELDMQILGAFGEQYAYLKLINHNTEIYSVRKNILDNNEIKNMIELVSKLDAKGLRALFCGAYAFNGNLTNQEILLKTNTFTQKEIFTTENKFEVDDHTLDVFSDLSFDDDDASDDYQLSIESRFSGGFLGKKIEFKINWMGVINDEMVTLKNLNVEYGMAKYNFKFLDYN